MIKTLMLIMIFNNLIDSSHLSPAWGFSCWIKADGKDIVFDTGSDCDILIENMSRKNLDPGDIDIIFISHDHYDHTTGLDTLLAVVSPDTKIFVPHTMFREYNDEKYPGWNFISVKDPIEIIPGIWSSGALPFKDDSSQSEQAMHIITSEGIVTITGCAHFDLCKMLKKSPDYLDREDFCLVTGGFHLLHQNNYQIGKFSKKLSKLNIKFIAPSHCTGGNAIEILKEQWGHKVLDLGLGKTFSIE